MTTTLERKKKTAPIDSQPAKRHRRTPEEMVADLEAKIAGVKARAATRGLKASPEGKALVTAVRAIDRAARVATETDDRGLERALEAARAPLSEKLLELGLRLSVSDGRTGRRRKAAVA
jgi:hypothetical protein